MFPQISRKQEVLKMGNTICFGGQNRRITWELLRTKQNKTLELERQGTRRSFASSRAENFAFHHMFTNLEEIFQENLSRKPAAGLMSPCNCRLGKGIPRLLSSTCLHGHQKN